MKNKRWLLLLIIAFPSLLWLILETSTINSRRLPIYGPKKVISKGDTSFYKVPDVFYNCASDTLMPYPITEPLYNIIFVNDTYRNDSYRLAGLWEYLNYKKSKVERLPFILVTPSNLNELPVYNELKKLGESKNVTFCSWPKSSFDSITQIYFKQKPYYIDYSFFMLIDSKRQIRGYYDGRYVAEIKRLIDEYQHLRLKEEKQQLINSNEIKQNS